MKVKSIAECPPWKPNFGLFENGRFTQVLLHTFLHTCNFLSLIVLSSSSSRIFHFKIPQFRLTAHEMLGLIPTASSKGSDDPAHMCSLARALTTHIHKVWMKIKTCVSMVI